MASTTSGTINASIGTELKKKVEHFVADHPDKYRTKSAFIFKACSDLLEKHESSTDIDKNKHYNVNEFKSPSYDTKYSRAQVLERIISNLEQQTKYAEAEGDTTSALKLSKEAGKYLKELLDETKKPTSDNIKIKRVHKNPSASSSKTVNIQEDDIEIIE
ncbi:hypothetical protein [Methanolobus sp. ZRKC5]|uniref:hypothetical protein n=1 Tax=unclassified Methanolobus TaxID=2629569 RepID=UPI00313D4C94